MGEDQVFVRGLERVLVHDARRVLDVAQYESVERERTSYVDEGDYYESEYYFLLLSSVLGMMMMASSRDFVSMFVDEARIAVQLSHAKWKPARRSKS